MRATLVRQGKVRDVYDLGDHFLMVASDRISAFDWVLSPGIPDKGRVLNKISEFWFEYLGVSNHWVSSNLGEIDLPEDQNIDELEGRSMIVRKCEVVPIECVVRGYLVGSGWKDYQTTGSVCGIDLPDNLLNCAQLDEPIFTPATKAEEGHDENISFDLMAKVIGAETAKRLKDQSIEIYLRGAEFAKTKGIIVADTKLEWGWDGGELILIDEVLTPDSSRFWPASEYQPGKNQPSFDKQFVREYLETTNWDKNSDPPELPDEIVSKTREKYIDAYERLTDNDFAWK